jgi:poly-gamma-glutamate synthesis protein (capsule biosynthesis protein)
MRASHRSGCPVGLQDLRHLRLSYVDFHGRAATGELVMHREVAQDVVRVFERLYAARWPIARMELVEAFDGDDDASMAANNTSAYNCRRVAGSPSWSEHAYGRAIDVNPLLNPHVKTGSVAPPSGRRYAHLDRSPGAAVPRGVITAGDVVVRAFADVGWGWGGDWTSSKDYQHFSATGR